jgi:hypothetical protein
MTELLTVEKLAKEFKVSSFWVRDHASGRYRLSEILESVGQFWMDDEAAGPIEYLVLLAFLAFVFLVFLKTQSGQSVMREVVRHFR